MPGGQRRTVHGQRRIPKRAANSRFWDVLAHLQLQPSQTSLRFQRPQLEQLGRKVPIDGNAGDIDPVSLQADGFFGNRNCVCPCARVEKIAIPSVQRKGVRSQRSTAWEYGSLAFCQMVATCTTQKTQRPRQAQLMRRRSVTRFWQKARALARHMVLTSIVAPLDRSNRG